MMKLKGFTLAEVLITLAVIGVVAAVTLPVLVANISKASVGPAFAKAVNTLESVNKTVLAENNARNLNQVCGDEYLVCIQKYLSANKITDIKTYNGYINASGGFSNASAGFLTNDGMAYYQTGEPDKTTTSETTGEESPYVLTAATGDYYGKYYDVYIDVDGPNKGFNGIGKDTFLVYVDLNGSVIPYGGKLYKNYSSGSDVLWETKCKAKTDPTDPNACAGSIADNGWKVIY